MTKGKAELHAHSWANRANPKSQAQGKHSAFWPADSLVKLSGARKKSSDYEVNELLPVQMKLPHPTQTDLAFSPKPETRLPRVLLFLAASIPPTKPGVAYPETCPPGTSFSALGVTFHQPEEARGRD